MSKISGYIGDAIGGASSMFRPMGTAIGAGWVLNATKKLSVKHKRRKSKHKYVGFGY